MGDLAYGYLYQTQGNPSSHFLDWLGHPLLLDTNSWNMGNLPPCSPSEQLTIEATNPSPSYVHKPQKAFALTEVVSTGIPQATAPQPLHPHRLNLLPQSVSSIRPLYNDRAAAMPAHSRAFRGSGIAAAAKEVSVAGMSARGTFNMQQCGLGASPVTRKSMVGKTLGNDIMPNIAGGDEPPRMLNSRTHSFRYEVSPVVFSCWS